MSRVEEIEAAIDVLPPEDYQRFAEWFRERENTRWDCRMDADSAAGKLDYLFNQADAALESGTLREWPARK